MKNTDIINFKSSVIEYLKSQYNESYEWYFIRTELYCDTWNYDRTEGKSRCFGSMIGIFNLWYRRSVNNEHNIPDWRRELIEIIEGS